MNLTTQEILNAERPDRTYTEECADREEDDIHTVRIGTHPRFGLGAPKSVKIFK